MEISAETGSLQHHVPSPLAPFTPNDKCSVQANPSVGSTVRNSIASPLTSPQYWEDVYAKEDAAYDETQQEGEDWFQRHVHRVLKHMFARQELNPATDHLLDLGCGNALFLVKLAEQGWKHLEGIDYAPSAVRYARKLIKEKQLCDTVKVSQRNILSRLALDAGAEQQDGKAHPSGSAMVTPMKGLSSPGISLASPATPIFLFNQGGTGSIEGGDLEDVAIDPTLSLPLRPDGYDVINDKGTFDVVWMNKAVGRYVKFISHYLKENGLYIVTSCNCTSTELRNIFCPRFTFLSSVNHPTLQYGGQTGQSIVTLAFRNEPSSESWTPSRGQ